MFAKLSASVCAAILLSGGMALAQPSSGANAKQADERQDRSASLRDDRQMDADSAVVKRDDAKAEELLRRAGHEKGAQRQADITAADNYKKQAQAERDRNAALRANNKGAMKDYKADLTHPH